MLAAGIKPYLTEDLRESLIENRTGKFNKTYSLGISFKTSADEHVGDLIIYFVAKGFGVEDSSGSIDVQFYVPFFMTQDAAGEHYLEEAAAMQFIFINYATEIQNVIDEALDALYEYYDNGTALKSLID